MNRSLACAFCALLVSLCPALLRAQELSILGGATTSGAFNRTSKAWQVDYRQDIYQNFDASIAYINEGHFSDHKRDGTAWQAWANLPLFDDKVALSFGVGAYYYFDTQPAGVGDSIDVHGTAPIFSASLTGYLSDRWFYRVLVNRISPKSDIQTNQVMVGVGYWFGPNRRPLGIDPNKGAAEPEFVTPPQLTLFGGQSVVNTFFDEKAWAGALEYRQGIMPHLDGSATYIYEGNPKTIRRSGFAVQAWPVNTFVDKSTSVGIGVGPYFFIDRRHPGTQFRNSPAAIAPLVSLTLAHQITDNLVTRFVWDRVTSAYKRDADIFLVGLGYQWR